jgi:LuxR family transcriptional regulator, maltose regulon positive regulatory protein
VMYASALTVSGQKISGIEGKLLATETALQNASQTDTNRDLIGHLAAIRAMVASPQYDIETMIAQSQRALKLLSPGNLTIRAIATWTMGFAHQVQGDRAEARHAFTEAIDFSQSSGNIMITMAAATCLGQVQEAENQLYPAEQSYRSVLDLVGEPSPPTTCEAYLGLARIYYQWDNLSAAKHYAQQALELSQQIEGIDTPIACNLLLARLLWLRGDTHGASSILSEAEQFALQHHFGSQMPLIIAEKVVLLLRQDNLAAAALLAEKHALAISQARVHLAQGNLAAALTELQQYRQQMEAKRWQDEQLKAMLLQGVAHYTKGDFDTAVNILEEALILAAPSGFIRLFVDEGALMAQLLHVVSARGTLSTYTGKLLAAFEREKRTHIGESYHPVPSAAQPLVEPLSERELEVLQLIDQGLSNREISEQLFLALSTVKGHNRNIFDKLQVKSRTEALAYAREIGLL